MKRPWMKWYPADWRADPRLRMCSLAARGLWVDLIAYMHEGEPYGHLTIDGVQPGTQGISSLVGRPLNETIKALAELEARNVFSRDDKGAIFSRRMVRDNAKAQKDRENGKAGGNPDLLKEGNRGVNPPDNVGDITPHKAQMPDTRVLPSFPPDLLLNASLGSSTSSLSRASASAVPWPADYRERFWELFPNKIGKASALKKLEKIAKSDRVTFLDLMAALDRYVRKTDDRPWCNPETWINQERWTDEPAKANGHGKPDLAAMCFDLADELRARETAGPTDRSIDLPGSHRNGR